MNESRNPVVVAALTAWAVMLAVLAWTIRKMGHSTCVCEHERSDFDGGHGPCLYCGQPVFCLEQFEEERVLWMAPQR